ncbi:MAG: dTDP-glucose 4,6-dehydratase [Thermoplasmatales archaeon]|nr:dTDP-glucose 4,6-dehydratase [Thermoplasmatales archaeon]
MVNIKIFVTGGLGFIGSNFINYWLNNHPEDYILNVDKLTYAADFSNIEEKLSSRNYEFVKEDICNIERMKSLSKGFDVIVNFAAESHVDNSITDASAFLNSNYYGVFSLLEAARNNDIRMHQVSTDEVFGSLSKMSREKFSENTRYDPKNPYSATKAAADHLVRAYINTYGLKATISNCSNNFGPNQHREKLIPKTILNALAGTKIPVYGSGNNIRDWVYVEDHCSGIDAILTRGRIGETYLIGARNERTNLEVIKLILSKLGKNENLIEFVEDRKGHDFRYSLDPSKIEKELGWKPTYQFDEAIVKTIDYYRRKYNFPA